MIEVEEGPSRRLVGASSLLKANSYTPVLSLATYKNLQSPPSADPTPNTEAALVESFKMALHSGMRSRKSPSRILLDELDGLQGRADLVDAHIQALPGAVRLEVLATSLSSPTKARVLAILRYGAPRTRTYLMNFTGLSSHSLGGHIRQLERAGLVRVHSNSTVSLNCPLPWSMVDIVAYEGKLSNWRRALHQAIGYRSFSHSVKVVIPAAGAQHAKKLVTLFRANGIGLISVADDGSTRIEIKSRKRRPASRRLYLMAVGVILKRFIGQKRRSHRRLRPESIQSI